MAFHTKDGIDQVSVEGNGPTGQGDLRWCPAPIRKSQHTHAPCQVKVGVEQRDPGATYEWGWNEFLILLKSPEIAGE